eukprot:gene18341-biopygen9945
MVHARAEQQHAANDGRAAPQPSSSTVRPAQTCDGSGGSGGSGWERVGAVGETAERTRPGMSGTGRLKIFLGQQFPKRSGG